MNQPPQRSAEEMREMAERLDQEGLPQVAQAVRAKIPIEEPIDEPTFFEDEDCCGKAQSRLEQLGYTVNRGGMINGVDRNETEEETKLINFLCDEWDYGFAPHPNRKDDDLNEPLPTPQASCALDGACESCQ